MQKEQLVLITLLNNFIHKTTPQLPEEINWDEVVYLAHINSVLGIISFMISRYHLQQDEEVLAACKSYYQRTYQRFCFLNEKIKEVTEMLSKATIDHVLFKGSVVKDFYPVPEFRSFGDVDILIQKDQRKNSRKLFSSNGYEESDPWEPVFNYRKGREYYEVHTKLLETEIPGKPSCKDFFMDPWRHVKLKDGHTYVFTPEFHFVYLLTHIAKHLTSSGAGIRMYLDLAVFIQHYDNSLDWSLIHEYLLKMELLGFAHTALFAVKQWFGVDSPLSEEERDGSFMEQFAESTLYGGTFGFEGSDKGQRDLRHEIRDASQLNRIRILQKRLFPPAKQIAPRYTYLQKRPWLLPVGWIHRFILTSRSHSAHRQEVRQLIHADAKEAEEWNEMIKKAGL